MPSQYSKAIHRALIGIAENIRLAKSFISGMDAERFSADTRTVYAVTRCLEIISEAVRKLPDDTIRRYPTVPWAKIKASGNVYRHEYDNVSPNILWFTVDSALQDLEKAVMSELRTMGDPER